MSGSYIYPLKRVFLNLSGGTVTGDTIFTQGVYANELSGGTIYSGSTLLDIIITNIAASVVSSSASTLTTLVQPGSNIATGGTSNMPTISVVASPSFNNIFSSGSSQLNTITAVSVSGGTISGGTLFSGSTNLNLIFHPLGANSVVSNGTNTYTGGTFFNQTVNVSALTINTLVASGSSQLNTITAVSVSGGTISGGTLFSGSTNLYSIFQQIGTDIQTAVQPGSNIITGGTLLVPIVSVVASPLFNNLNFSGTAIGGIIQAGAGTFTSLSATTLSGGTIFSGSTNLQTTFNLLNSQLVTKANLSGATFTGAVSATAITDTQLISGQAVYASVGGLLKTNSGFTYDDSIGILYANNMQVGSPSYSGTVTIWGNVNVMGQAISAYTSDLLIKDNNITLNYNPTASTTSTSIGAGFNIQDGSGVVGTDVFFDIRGSAATIYNRSFATNLMDIRIRESGTTSSPNGVRVLVERDILDAGLF